MRVFSCQCVVVWVYVFVRDCVYVFPYVDKCVCVCFRVCLCMCVCFRVYVCSKMKSKRPPATRQENYQYWPSLWQQGNTRTFKDVLSWYDNKDVVPTLEAMQRMIDFYHNKRIDILKLGCTFPDLANTCLLKSTNAKFHPFTESDKDLLEKLREDMVAGPSIVFTIEAVVDETFIRDSTNWCKTLVGIDAKKL